MISRCLPGTYRRLLSLLQTCHVRRNTNMTKSIAALNSVGRSDLRSLLLDIGDLQLTADDCKHLHKTISTKPGSLSFWSVLMRTASEMDLPQIANGAATYIMENQEVQTTGCVLEALHVLANSNRLDDFRSLYSSCMQRLNEAEIAVVADELMSVLCMTPDWELAYSLLPFATTHKANRILCEAAARFASHEQMITMLNNLPFSQTVLSDAFFSTFLSRLPKTEEAYGYVTDLLKNAQRLCWKLTEFSANSLTNWLNSHPIQAYRATSDVLFVDELCSHCKQKAPTVQFSADMLENLCKVFYETVIKGQMYVTGTPDDVRSLDVFIKHQVDKFDCVIDIQNLNYMLPDPFDVTDSVKQILETISTFHRRYNFRRFCLVSKGNRVIRSRPFREQIRSIGSKLGVSVFDFLVDKRSDDDVFTIYLALWSGPHCYILSNDEFRQHRCSLGVENEKNFIRWQSARQILIGKKYQRNFSLPIPCEILGTMQTGCHIPYEKNDSTAWLCVQPNST